MSFELLKQDTRKKELIAIRLEANQLKAIKDECEKRGLSLSSTIRELCDEGLKNG